MSGDERRSERVAVVDDERRIREMLRIGLTQHGFATRTANDGAEAIALVRDWDPQCIILDVMMPQIDGMALIPMLRKLTDAPIIMLTARGEVRDRIDGLDAGADDYLVKPFDLGELCARVRTALRRPALERIRNIRYADLTIDLETRRVHRGDREIQLSAREFNLLVALARRPQRVFTREELLDLVWGADHDVLPAIVENYISYLRSKIDVAPGPKLLHTIRGVGYSLRGA